MAYSSSIEWTESSWNPVTGCTKVSSGCANCYAEKMANRLQAMGLKKYKNAFKLTVHEEALKEPLKWKKSHTIFVCSMSDLFHKDVPNDFIDKVMKVIEQTPQHQYQILTKRVERMAEYFSDRNVPKNAWLGITVDVQLSKSKIDFLRQLKAPVKFLSCEPLIEDLGTLNLTGIDWVIVGGESGPKARPMKPEWVEKIRIQCERHHVLFFFKQWGTWGSDGIKRNKKINGKKINGKIIQQMPMSEL